MSKTMDPETSRKAKSGDQVTSVVTSIVLLTLHCVCWNEIKDFEIVLNFSNLHSMHTKLKPFQNNFWKIRRMIKFLYVLCNSSKNSFHNLLFNKKQNYSPEGKILSWKALKGDRLFSISGTYFSNWSHYLHLPLASWKVHNLSSLHKSLQG